MIGAVNYCWVWYERPEGIKAGWSLGQAYYYHHYKCMFNSRNCIFPAGLSLCVTQYYRSCGAGLLYHVTFQEVHTHRRKEVESKHYGAVQELTSEQQRFDWTEIIFSLRKKGGYIRAVGLFLWWASWQTKILLFMEFSKSCNLASNAYFQCLNTFLGIPTDTGLDFGEIIVTRLFSQAYFSEAIIFSRVVASF